MTIKTKTQPKDFQQRITIYLGYGLFLLSVVAFIITLLPWNGNIWSSEFNTAAVTFASGLMTILPAFGGYLMGRFAVKKSDKRSRQYAGVLFGVLGYWLALVLIALTTFLANYTFIGEWVSSIMGQVVAYAVPALISLVSVGIVATLYRHKEPQVAVLRYVPYRIVFMCCVAVLFVLSGVSVAASSWNGVDFWSSFAVFILPVVMVGILILFGAWLVGAKNGNWGVRVLKSLIAMSYSFATIAVLSQLLWFNPALASWSLVVAIIVWVAYIIVLRKYPRNEK